MRALGLLILVLCHQVLNSRDFGLPQQRRRLYIVAGIGLPVLGSELRIWFGMARAFTSEALVSLFAL